MSVRENSFPVSLFSASIRTHQQLFSLLDKASAIPDEIRKIQLIPQDKVHQVSFFCYLPHEHIPFYLGLNSTSEKWIRNKRTKFWFQDLLQLRCPPNRVQVAVRYLLLQKTENVDTFDSKFQNIFDPINESHNKGNFLVTGIDYGHQAVVLLQHDVHEQQNVQSELLLATKTFFTALAESQDTEVSCSKILSETSCRFYSDTGTASEWMPFEDCVNRHIKPFLLLRNFRQGKPQVMQIYPVTRHLPGPIVSQFNNFEQHVSVLLDYLNKIEEQTSQIISDPFLQRIAHVKEHSNAFIKAVSHLRTLFESFPFLGASDDLLPAINVCRYYSTSAVLDEWISRKRKEINSLKRLLQGTSLTIESQENLYHKLSGKAFRVFQLNTVPSRDPIIDEIYQQMKQEVASPLFRIFKVGTAPVSHLDRVLEKFSLFTLKAKKSVNVLSILSPSDFFPDGSIIKFNSRTTLTNLNQSFSGSPLDHSSSLSYLENAPRNSGTLNRFVYTVLKRCVLYKSGQPSIYNLQVVEKTPGRFHFGEVSHSNSVGWPFRFRQEHSGSRHDQLCARY